MATPIPGNVRDGVAFVDSDGFAQVGTLVVPSPADVLAGVAYGASGAEFLGTLPNFVSSSAIMQNGEVKSPLFIGTDYLNSAGNGFRFRVVAPEGVDPVTVDIHFEGRGACDESRQGPSRFNKPLDPGHAWDSIATSVTPVTVGGVAYWDCEFDLTAEQTADFHEAPHYWWVLMETMTADVVLKSYREPLIFLRA